MPCTALTLVTLLALSAPPTGAEVSDLAPGAKVRIRFCLVSLVDDVQVPAQESGLLISLPAVEGTQVKREDLLAQIDDRKSQMQRQAAMVELQAAQTKANDEIEVHYAEAAYEVAAAEYTQAVEINRRVAGTIPGNELRRLQLTQHRSRLQIDRSQLDLKVARMTAEVNQAAVKSAEEEIRRRQILSPVDGVVVSVHRHAGEWVNAGDTVLRVVRMDQLWIEGFVSSDEFDPGEIANRPVTVQVALARGRVMEFPGKVVFVSPLVQAGNKYRVRAEVPNRQENGYWLLRPGVTAEMTIH